MCPTERVPVYRITGGEDVPYGLLETYCEPDPTGELQEWMVGIVVPLGPLHLHELQLRLSHGPIEVDCTWNWWDDEAPDEWSVSNCPVAGLRLTFTCRPGFSPSTPTGRSCSSSSAGRVSWRWCPDYRTRSVTSLSPGARERSGGASR